MNTDEIRITSRGDGMEEALAVTERLGLESGLGHKENLRLRLLAEELIGLMRGIAGSVEADYQVGQKNKEFTLRLRADVNMSMELRRQLLAASSSGKNAAAKGLMGRIRNMVAAFILMEKGDSTLPSGLSMGLMSMGSPSVYRSGDTYAWTLKRYMSQVRSNLAQDEETAEAWDELEKSIVANLADDVSVKIEGSDVEIAITKAF